MSASISEQADTLASWGMERSGLLILMSPCHGRCIFCAQPAVTHPPPSDWTPWDRVSRYLDGNRSVGLRRLCIGGTEPTSHPDFERTLRLARDVGFDRIELMTSGLALSEDGVAEAWAASGIRSIAVPIYGIQAGQHDGVVRVPAFDRLVAGLDAAHGAGITVHTHTLALAETLPGLGELARFVSTRWGTPLAIAPARPKDAVWDYRGRAPALADVESAIRGVPRAHLQLTGWPTCVAPTHPRGAASVMKLYFLGQSRSFHASCGPCQARETCPGVVDALLARDGAAGLQPILNEHG